jgi:PhnB protein
MITLAPYLGLNGKAREAMNFYKDCFGGELSFLTFKEMPNCPEGKEDDILHFMIHKDSFMLMGSDMSAPTGFTIGTDMSISANFTKEEEIKKVFKKLSEGGMIIEELHLAFWGDFFGVVKDKFDKVWMLNLDKKHIK